MIVKVKIIDNTRTADIAEGISWSLVREIDESTWEISAPEYEAELERKALKKVAELVIKEKFDTLSESERSVFMPLFEDNPSGEIKVRDGKLVKEDKPK